MKLKNIVVVLALGLGALALPSCDSRDEVLSYTPDKIMEYIEEYHPGAEVLIIKYDKRDGEYEVILSNGWELTFDKNFRAIDADFN